MLEFFAIVGVVAAVLGSVIVIKFLIIHRQEQQDERSEARALESDAG
jgi:hypothetical protein